MADMTASTAEARVLVIDDEPIIAKTLAIVFSNAGYETWAVESAEAAFALLIAEKWIPQLVLIDVHLPGMNGIDLAIRIKAQWPGCYLSLFSGQAATTDLLETATRNGHRFDVVAKPVHPTELLGMAGRLFHEESRSISDKK